MPNQHIDLTVMIVISNKSPVNGSIGALAGPLLDAPLREPAKCNCEYSTRHTVSTVFYRRFQQLQQSVQCERAATRESAGLLARDAGRALVQRHCVCCCQWWHWQWWWRRWNCYLHWHEHRWGLALAQAHLCLCLCQRVWEWLMCPHSKLLSITLIFNRILILILMLVQLSLLEWPLILLAVFGFRYQGWSDKALSPAFLASSCNQESWLLVLKRKDNLISFIVYSFYLLNSPIPYQNYFKNLHFLIASFISMILLQKSVVTKLKMLMFSISMIFQVIFESQLSIS